MLWEWHNHYLLTPNADGKSGEVLSSAKHFLNFKTWLQHHPERLTWEINMKCLHTARPNVRKPRDLKLIWKDVIHTLQARLHSRCSLTRSAEQLQWRFCLNKRVGIMSLETDLDHTRRAVWSHFIYHLNVFLSYRLGECCNTVVLWSSRYVLWKLHLPFHHYMGSVDNDWNFHLWVKCSFSVNQWVLDFQEKIKKKGRGQSGETWIH